MVRFLRQIIRPTSAVYLLAHVVLLAVGLYFVRGGSGLLAQGIGSSLVAAAIAGWVLFLHVLVDQQTRESVDIVIHRLGLVTGFTHRGAAIREEYRERVGAARKSIDIMGYGLSTLREDFRNEFAAWRERAHVRILLLDPTYPQANVTYAEQRDREEDEPLGSIAAEVSHFVNEIRELLNERFEVRLYTCLPSVNVFRVDDEMFWGPYLMNTASRNTPTFVVRASGELFPVFQQHFEDIWQNHSRPVDPAV